jgi:lysophospholipase L1-like esterase
MHTEARLARSRFLAFGDSLTAGTTSPTLTRLLNAGLPQSYPARLQALLVQQYAEQRFSMVNEGKPGEFAADALSRLTGALQVALPELVILLHGVNDATFTRLSGVRAIAGAIARMAQEARLAGAEVIICTLPPQRAGGLRVADPAIVTAYNEALRQVADDEGAMLVDFDRDVDPELIGVDGLHPTQEGYDSMAAVLFNAIRARFEFLPE